MTKKVLILGSTKETDNANYCQHSSYEIWDKSEKVERTYLDLANNTDVTHDLNKLPLPFKDNEFNEILASHIIEHTIPWQIVDLMNELHRISKKSSKITIFVPHFSNSAALTHLTHYKAFSSGTLNFICDNIKEWEKYIKGKFNLVLSKVTIPRRYIFCRWVPIGFYESFLSRIFPAHEIKYVLEVLK